MKEILDKSTGAILFKKDPVDLLDEKVKYLESRIEHLEDKIELLNNTIIELERYN